MARRVTLEDILEGALENQCPNDPPCCDVREPLEHNDWCGVCLLVTDVRAWQHKGDTK